VYYLQQVCYGVPSGFRAGLHWTLFRRTWPEGERCLLQRHSALSADAACDCVLAGDMFVLQQDSTPAHRARATVEYLRQATPDFISPYLWPPNSPDLNPVNYKIRDCLVFKTVFIRSAYTTSTSWNSTWLMYGQTVGRQSLTGPSMSGENGFRPVSVWKDTISNMPCKSVLFLLTCLPSYLQVL